MESPLPKPLNAQTAQDRDKDKEPMSSASRRNKHVVKVFPQSVNTVFQRVQNETKQPPLAMPPKKSDTVSKALAARHRNQLSQLP